MSDTIELVSNVPPSPASHVLDDSTITPEIWQGFSKIARALTARAAGARYDEEEGAGAGPSTFLLIRLACEPFRLQG